MAAAITLTLDAELDDLTEDTKDYIHSQLADILQVRDTNTVGRSILPCLCAPLGGNRKHINCVRIR